mmetsp:Transcript_32191/g.52013  ORF Transcript_32191/g.52013 Transcript_32191/m.52013 type:complete len:165 (+) Transcript_32191:966-1460(+)
MNRNYVYRALVGACALITVRDNVLIFRQVQGSSMQPTFNPDVSKYPDVVFIEKVSLWRYRYVRGDVVCFYAPDNPNRLHVKRLIALEGDYIRPRDYRWGGLQKIPRGHGWVEGDNLSYSNDSNVYGPIPLGLIEGRVQAVVWPPSRISWIRNHLPEGRIIDSNG